MISRLGDSAGRVSLPLTPFEHYMLADDRPEYPMSYFLRLTFSGTFVNQQWPYNPATPHGAWEYHEHLIPESPRKPIRIWMHVGDRDNLGTRDNHHDWVLANEFMARMLAAKGYQYQYVFARNSGHTDRTVKAQTLPQALEWLWRGYPK